MEALIRNQKMLNIYNQSANEFWKNNRKPESNYDLTELKSNMGNLLGKLGRKQGRQNFARIDVESCNKEFIFDEAQIQQLYEARRKDEIDHRVKKSSSLLQQQKNERTRSTLRQYVITDVNNLKQSRARPKHGQSANNIPTIEDLDSKSSSRSPSKSASASDNELSKSPHSRKSSQSRYTSSRLLQKSTVRPTSNSKGRQLELLDSHWSHKFKLGKPHPIESCLTSISREKQSSK